MNNYGFMAARRRAQDKKESSRRESQTAPREKKQPDLRLYPLDNSAFEPFTHIKWGANRDIAEAVLSRLETDRFQLLQLPTGTGKTAIAVELLGLEQARLGKKLPFIVVASRAIMDRGSWQRTIKSWNAAHPDTILEPVMLETFDRFANILDDRRTLVQTLKLMGKDGIVVLDEVHNYKNPMSKRSKKLRRLKQLRRVGLTATPFTNDSVMDGCSYLIMNGMYNSKSKFIQGHNLEHLIGMHGELLIYDPDTHRISQDRWPSYQRFVDELSQVIYSPDIDMSDITMPTVNSRLIQLPNDIVLTANLYSLRDAFRVGAFDSATEYTLEIVKAIGESKVRLNALIELLKQPGAIQPLVFYWNTDVLAAIESRLQSEGISYQIISGAHSAAEVDFDRDDPILVQYQAGSEGIEMPRSNLTIFYQNQNSASRLEQAKGRNVRRGNSHRVSQYSLVSDCRFDQIVFERLSDRLDTSMQVLSDIAVQLDQES